MLARRIGELVVAPDQFERRAGPGLYAIAAGQPLAAESGVGEVLPDALDGAGQHALQAHGVGVADDGVVGFGGGDGCVHFFFFLLLCAGGATRLPVLPGWSSARSEEHTSELQSLMRISYAVFCLKKKKTTIR